VKIKQEEERKGGVFFALSSRRLLDRARSSSPGLVRTTFAVKIKQEEERKGGVFFGAIVAPAEG
jgi:hypothetical protein